MVERLRANRDFCRAALREMPGVVVPEPEGAFYLFPRIGGVTDSFEFCRRLLVKPRLAWRRGWRLGQAGGLRADLLRRRPGDARIRHGAARRVPAAR